MVDDTIEPLIEREIRLEIGNAILERGEPVYRGEITLSTYRKYFPEGDQYKLIYLSLKEKHPDLAEVMAAYFEANKKRDQAVKRQDFVAAERINVRRRNSCSKLTKILLNLK